VGKKTWTVESDVPIGPGEHTVAMAFTTNGDFSGTARLLLDGEVVGEGAIDMTTPVRYSITGAGLTCGWEQGPPVATGYRTPFDFTGRLGPVTVDVEGVAHEDLVATFASIMAEQ
jgi:hypothetical protein